MKFHIRNLGCKMNWLDAARVSAALQGAGHVLVDDEAEAEYVLVNSCTVTAEADRKSRQMAQSARRADKEVVVFGCGPRADREGWRRRLPETVRLEDESSLLRRFGAEEGGEPFPALSRTRLPVAIQTGCDDTCSFCITRIARGAHRSHPAQRIVEHVRTAAELGIREVVLTGINLAAWGSSHTKAAPAEARLGELLRRLLDETGIPRIRLSSLGPQYLQRDFFAAFADPRVCDHLHLSIQSGSDSVLERMGRGHDAATVERVVERARALRPDLALTADFIVGFPGETGAEFAATAGLVERLGFAKLHVFPFSPREGTPAAALPDGLDPTERKRRAAELRALGQATRRTFLDSQLGRRHTVLTERNETGLTTNYIRVRTPDAAEGDLVETVLTPDNLADS